MYTFNYNFLNPSLVEKQHTLHLGPHLTLPLLPPTSSRYGTSHCRDLRFCLIHTQGSQRNYIEDLIRASEMNGGRIGSDGEVEEEDVEKQINYDGRGVKN